MSVATKLSTFARNQLVLGQATDERNHIEHSIERVKRVILGQIGDEIEDIVVFGSWTRNTILPRQYDSQSDVDVLVLFKKGNMYGPNTYTDHLRKAIMIGYRYSEVHRSFPTIQIEMRHLIFDLVPSYRIHQQYRGSMCEKYFIPDKFQKWISTTPNDINSILSRKNQEVGGNIMRQLIRLCKYWNASHGYQYESYLMEKEILNMHFWFCTTLYDYFIFAMRILAKDNDSKRAIEYMEKYNIMGDELRQFSWLNHLLPGIINVC